MIDPTYVLLAICYPTSAAYAYLAVVLRNAESSRHRIRGAMASFMAAANYLLAAIYFERLDLPTPFL